MTNLSNICSPAMRRIGNAIQKATATAAATATATTKAPNNKAVSTAAWRRLYLSKAGGRRAAGTGAASSRLGPLSFGASQAQQEKPGAEAAVPLSQYRQLSTSIEDPVAEGKAVLSELEASSGARMAEYDGSWAMAPVPLDAKQVARLTRALEVGSGAYTESEAAELLRLLTHRIPPGVDDAAYVKASWLSSVAGGLWAGRPP